MKARTDGVGWGGEGEKGGEKERARLPYSRMPTGVTGMKYTIPETSRQSLRRGRMLHSPKRPLSNVLTHTKSTQDEQQQLCGRHLSR